MSVQGGERKFGLLVDVVRNQNQRRMTAQSSSGDFDDDQVSVRSYRSYRSTFSSRSSARNQPRTFSLARAKETAFQRVKATQPESVTTKFIRCVKGPHIDDFLHNVILFVGAHLKLKNIKDSTNALMQGETPSDEMLQKIDQSELELKKATRVFGRTYSRLVLQYGAQFKQNQKQDQIFFETLFIYILKVLALAFRQEVMPEIETELGRVIRSQPYNLNSRRRETKKELLTAKEIYQLKYEGDPAVNRRKLAEYYRKPSSVHSFLHQRSPLISNLLPSPRQKAAAVSPRRHPGEDSSDEDDRPPTPDPLDVVISQTPYSNFTKEEGSPHHHHHPHSPGHHPHLTPGTPGSLGRSPLASQHSPLSRLGQMGQGVSTTNLHSGAMMRDTSMFSHPVYGDGVDHNRPRGPAARIGRSNSKNLGTLLDQKLPHILLIGAKERSAKAALQKASDSQI